MAANEDNRDPGAHVAKIKRIIGIKATKAAARHSTHGISAKAQRKPLRSASLLSVGVAIGLGVGWAGGRATAGSS